MDAGGETARGRKRCMRIGDAFGECEAALFYLLER